MNNLLQPRNLFLAILTIGWFALAARNVVDPDVWWHLKTGEYIVAHRAIPHADPFSYTRAGQPWVAHEWLAELAIFGLYRAAGWTGLIVVFAAIVSCAFVLLFLRCGGSRYVAGIVTMLGAYATAPVWGVRPQVLSLLLTSLWLLLLERSERDAKFLWWTLPVMLLWVNLHAGFALGIALLALYFVGEFVERWLGEQAVRPSSPRLRALGTILVLNLAVALLNPNGARMYSYPIETLGSRAMQNYIAEWASPNFHRGEYWPFLLLLLATVAALAQTRLRARPRDLLLLLVSTLAALSSIRMIPFFVLVAVPMVAKSITVRARSGGQIRAPSPFRPGLNAVIMLALAGFAGIHICRVIRHQPEAEAGAFPAAAVAYLQAHSSSIPLFNPYDWGGYLIWNLSPRTRVFIDGRADLYGESLLDQFAKTYQLKADWQQTLTQWQIGAVIVPPDSALAAGLRAKAGWLAVYEDNRAVIFLRGIRTEAP